MGTPMANEQWNCTCVEHGDPIKNMRNGYTAGASDPSAAHAEFDRLVRAVGLDAYHAAALEREAIAAWADSYAEYRDTTLPDADVPTMLRTFAQAIRNGEHWKGAR